VRALTTNVTQAVEEGLRLWVARARRRTARRNAKQHQGQPRALPAPAEALERPLWAFPSWFQRIECERCGKVQLINEVHMQKRHLPLRIILASDAP
jgi:hypothetical protein